MARNVNKVILSILLLVPALSAVAQDITFQLRSSTIVAAGEVFRVEYAATGDPSKFNRPDNFSGPDSFPGFDVIAGPTESYREHEININGQGTKSRTYSYTYLLMSNEAGIYNIPPATVTVNGTSYSTKATPIEVADAESISRNQLPGGGRQQPGQQDRQNQQPEQPTIGADDLFVRILVDKTNVYKGQPVRVSFKLYTRVGLTGLESPRLPAFNGFWTQELDTRHYPWQKENYQSKIYETKIIKEYLIFPQQAGPLQVEQFEVTAGIQTVSRPRAQSLLEEMMSGGPNIQEFRKKLVASPVRINVEDLPAGAPAGFNGAVGEFSLSSELPSSVIGLNSSANLTIKITGTGNLPLVQAPILDLPASFEQYNVKTTESLQTIGAGISGYRQFEYPFIARAEGDYNIDPVQFTYFNPKTATYVTLNTQSFDMSVFADSTSARTPVSGIISGMTKEDIRMLGQDIRFIKIGTSGVFRQGSILFLSPLYFGLLGAIVALFVFMLITLRKRIRQMQDMAALKGKRANKVALQRLKAADGFLKQGDSRRFHEEMLRAMWGYMSDKLNIPVAILTKENVREELLKRDVNPDTVKKYVDCISDCEYAQYSPAGSSAMHDAYRSAVEVISRIESVIRKKG